MPTRTKKGAVKKSVKKKKQKKKSRSNSRRIIFFLMLLISACAAIFIYYNKSNLINSRYYKLIAVKLNKIDEYKDSLFTEKWYAKLYFGDEGSDYLIKEFRRVSSSDAPERMAAVLIEELIKGPYAKGVRTIPEGTEIRSVEHDRDQTPAENAANYFYYLITHYPTSPFSRELSELHPGGSSSEIMTVFSIVNTLTENIEGIGGIRILIDGKAVDTIAGHIDCRQPFSPNMKIVR